MEIVLIANEKGGTGKTATAVCLANALVGLGYRILTVDFDPSGNLSHATLEEDPNFVLYDALTGKCTLEQAIYHTEICDVLPTIRDLELDVAPAAEFLIASGNSKSLSEIANRLTGRSGAEKVLSSLLRSEKANLAAKYDFVIIDSAPSDNILITNAIVAADTILIPCEPSQSGLDGMWMFMSSVATAKRNYVDAHAEIDGIVLSKYTEDGSNYLESVQSIRNAAEARSLYLYETAIRESKNIPHALGHYRPILSYLNVLGAGHGPVDALNLALEFLDSRGMEPKVDFPGVQRNEKGRLVYVRPAKKEA